MVGGNGGFFGHKVIKRFLDEGWEFRQTSVDGVSLRISEIGTNLLCDMTEK